MKKSYIIRKCIQLYSKVKYSNLLRPQYEHRKLTMMTKKYQKTEAISRLTSLPKQIRDNNPLRIYTTQYKHSTMYQ
jgi:hypothetical protein